MNEPPRRHNPPSPEEHELAASAPPGHLVGPAISHYLEQRGFSAVLRLGEVVQVWESTVGSQIAAHCRPVRLQGDSLIVEVDHSSWLTELAFQENRILEGLRAQIGDRVADHVKARVQRSLGVE